MLPSALTFGIRDRGIGEEIRCAAISSAYAVCSARCPASSRPPQAIIWGGRKNRGFRAAAPKWVLMDGVSDNVKPQTVNSIGTLRGLMPSAEMVIAPLYSPGMASLGARTSTHSGWLESGAMSNGAAGKRAGTGGLPVLGSRKGIRASGYQPRAPLDLGLNFVTSM